AELRQLASRLRRCQHGVRVAPRVVQRIDEHFFEMCQPMRAVEGSQSIAELDVAASPNGSDRAVFRKQIAPAKQCHRSVSQYRAVVLECEPAVSLEPHVSRVGCDDVCSLERLHLACDSLRMREIVGVLDCQEVTPGGLWRNVPARVRPDIALITDDDYPGIRTA